MAEHRQPNKPTVNLPTQNTSETIISMILGLLVLAIIGSFGYSFFRSWRSQNQTASSEPTPVPSPMIVEELPQSVETETDAETGREVPKNLPAQYTVKTGDSTWKIAEAFYGSGFNYIDIEVANELSRDQQLTAGMELIIPRVAVRAAQEAGMIEYTVKEGSDREVTPGPSKGDNQAAQAELEKTE